MCIRDRKGTVHIFSCASDQANNSTAEQPARQYDIPGAPPEEELATNPKSSLSWVQDYLPIPSYFADSEWSFAQMQLPAMNRVCAFGSDGTSVYAVGEDGVCLLYTSPSPRDRTRSRMPSSA
eukprot:TRINITY_DN2863_c0_g1_i3.p1 TRINITY_DN2863_c0_g1~~TRINITY_DN2863_c0_g1_i3.p1  ORF type:complete len:122 (-),score=38.36 TRINITY_DN2863_c0_g1_i3:140-505(-)